MPNYDEITASDDGVQGSWLIELDDDGVPGGWRGPWDDPDDHAELRAQAEDAENRLIARPSPALPTLRPLPAVARG